jgi:catechol 2,3-dioxygenase-like lactoylglutathione lyase family enzyme
MLSHVHLGTNDFASAFRFYAVLLEELGLRLRVHDPGKPWAIWQPQEGGRPLFIVGAPFDGAPASAGNGQMVALAAQSRATVDRCHTLALSLGGVCDGAPGLRPHYHANYYGAYFRDPDGNKLCVCCHQAE